MKKVSVIVPVYNAEDTLFRCIGSIINQTYENVEIIAINDGSSDNSINLLKEFEKDNDSLIIIDKKNEGVSVTRNLGIEKSSGDYIMFVDNDDYLDKDYIKTYMSYIKKQKYDIVIGGYKRIDNNEKKLYNQILKKDTEWSKYIVLAPWAKLYKKNFLIDNNIKFLSYGIGEDVYFNLLAYSKQPNIKIISDDKYIWYYNNKSVSNTKQKGLKKNVDIVFLLEKMLSFLDVNDEYNRYFIKRYIIWYLLFSGKSAQKDTFLEELERFNIWITKNDLKRTFSPFSLKIEGESFKNRMIVFIFEFLNKTNLIKLFATFYCRGVNK